MKKHPIQPVVCSGAVSECANANYGIGCYHRMFHEYTNNCKVCTSLDDGTHLCSVVKKMCACREAPA